MVEHLKSVARISAQAGWSLVKILALGVFSTATALAFAIPLVAYDAFVEEANLFTAKPIQLFLIVVIGFCLYPLFVFGSRYALKKSIHLLVLEKADSVIRPLLDKIIGKFKEKQSMQIKSAADFSLVKLKLLHEAKASHENRLVRRAVAYGFSKIQMDDVDFSQENVDFYEVIKLKTVSTVHDISEPSRTFFWVILGVQWMAFLVLVMLEKL